MNDKNPDRIVHEVDGVGYHRIIVNDVPGEWFPPKEIAFGGCYYATLCIQGSANLPQVFSIIEEDFAVLPATEDYGGDPE